MLKYLAIIALALYIFPMQAYTQTEKAQQTPGGDKPTPATPNVAVQYGGSQDLKPEPEQHAGADIRVVSTPPKDRYDKAAFWVNLALAVVGFCGVGIGVGTLIKIERQTAATEKAAEAARLNIQAFINSERPWIKVDVVKKDEERGVGMLVVAINCGRTPAAILSKNKSFCTVSPLDFLPQNPLYKADRFEHPQILFPGDRLELYWLISPKDVTGFDKDSPEMQKWANFPDSGVETNMFGNVIYRDTLSKDAVECETRWCYLAIPWDNPEKFVLLEKHYEESYSRRT